MEKINYKHICVGFYPDGSFSLSYVSNNKKFFKRRYMGYTLREAFNLFKKYVYQEAINE